ncbi:ABC transporter substrate-binding protein [Aggregatibacter actinomycetemcomitans]|uniref:ABC transporter substrate-binding protein n=1 Tax=Aggregatibacter actinomycetemcomitans TaxID=714 RepID=UPI0011DB7D2D|nr:ABC transporter substrate-binding protein [Aggregatibacter actinomycetemcomitans]TYB29502.1 ABC transporter substrate-binding protein [Aggregatibacter actinomycetemcomitans]
MKFKTLLGALLLGVFSTSVWADRVITDQLDRQVTIPDHIHRAVILQHQTLNLAVQLDATKQIAGVLSNWQKQLGKDFVRLAPELANLPMPGDLNTANIESLMEIKPDVVFVTNYAPKEMIEKISQMNVPVIAISLRSGDKTEQSKLNPSLADENNAYNEGLKRGIEIIAEVFEKKAQGEELIKATFANREMLAARLGNIPAEKRVRTYIANPNLGTYGSGKYTGLMLEHAGAYNVAAESVKGFQTVSMEEVLKWNPAVILVQDRYPNVVDDITTDKVWATIEAVKNHRVLLMPEYAKAWGYPMPEAIALGEVWLAKVLYPALFRDVDLDKMVNDYYLKFYRQPYKAAK